MTSMSDLNINVKIWGGWGVLLDQLIDYFTVTPFHHYIFLNVLAVQIKEIFESIKRKLDISELSITN